MGFFRVLGVNSFISWVLLIFGLLSMYAMGSSLYFLHKEIFKKNDELVRKIVFDSMAMSFVLVMLLHIIQMIIRIVHFQRTGQDINLVVTPGLAIYQLGDPSLHLESFGVDMGIFALCLFANRLRYRV
ncbi:hypothetical protein [Enterococcus sp. AZ196]|uniref:hypothetical protein n=1 Tax=Enterococcus sp. AZ196 TaxID=2774659 RepID=UPI003D29F523